jgi:glucose-6-phosphate isomerase
MVGAVMLSFTLGFDTFLQFLEGAYEMDQAALKTTFDENLPLMSALLSFWNTTYLKFKTVAVIPYSQALHRLPAHLQQLDMESNGKRINRQAKFIDYLTGPVLWGEPGTNGQHSFFQLLHQGTLVVPIEFIGFSNSQYGTDLLIEGSTSQEKLNGNLLAQVLALAYGQPSTNPNTDFPGNRPSRLLIGNRCDALTLGSLIAYYEHKVAFHGFLLNINSFDQEGVQLGKKLATEMIQGLAHQREGVHVQNNLKKSFFELFKNSKEG